ncbi:MAG: TonB-dependent receptor [Rhodospirillaceae bacterium]|nr:TonB-dependent receptor [Rhodospirillaceae bacterium]
MKIFKTTMLLSASSAILLTAMPAMAQIEEIIVTARQRSESLRDVPATISAFTAETLANAGVNRVDDFIALTPGLTIVSGNDEVGSNQVNIRGINGARDAENSFGLIIDGILMTNTAAINREYPDLQQIEILKGPQGALYGRNAAAGAIIINTKKPTDKQETTLKATAADNKTFATMVSTTGPINEKTFYKLQADWRRTDGFFKNTFMNQKNVDDYEGYNINGRLVFEPNDDTSVDLKARWGQVDGAAINFNAVFALPAFATALGNPDLYEDVNKHKLSYIFNIDPENDQDNLELSGKIDQQYNSGTLTAWVLYSNIKNDFYSDGTSAAFGFFNQDPTCRQSVTQLSNARYVLPSPQFLATTPEGSFLGAYTPTACDGTQYQVRNQKDISAEVRFASPADQQLRWLIGAYGLHIDREVGVNLGIDRGKGVTEQLYLPRGDQNATESLVHDNFKSNVYSAFGQVAYDVQENTEFAVALRYDREERKVHNLVPATARTQYVDFTNDGISSGNAFLNPSLDPTINPAGVRDKKTTFDQVEPKISLTHKLDDVTLYANWGIGFKAGGFNSQGANAIVNVFFNRAPVSAGIIINDDYREETSSAFEVGFKSEFLDKRVSLEAAAYHNTVDDMQFFEFLVGPFGLLRVVNNIDKVRLVGGEVSLNAQLTDEWSIYGGGNVTDSKIKKMVSRPDTVGNKSPYTADYTLSFGTQLLAPVTESFDLLARADANVVGPTWFHVVQCQNRPTLFGAPSNGCKQRRNTYTTVDLRIGLQSDAWSVTAFAKNLANSKHLEEVIPAPEFGGSFVSPGARRLVGVDASLKF